LHSQGEIMTSGKIGRHLLVECLIAQGVTHAFGVSGKSCLAVPDGFHVHADKIRFVINCNAASAALHNPDFAALARPEGTLNEVALDPEVINARGTLSAISQAALKSGHLLNGP